MPITKYRGTNYVFNYQKREFLRYTRVDSDGNRICYWTPGTRHAKAYKNPTNAEKMARALNRHLGGRPCQAVGGVAAECLDMINRRDGEGAGRGEDPSTALRMTGNGGDGGPGEDPSTALRMTGDRGAGEDPSTALRMTGGRCAQDDREALRSG